MKIAYVWGGRGGGAIDMCMYVFLKGLPMIA